MPPTETSRPWWLLPVGRVHPAWWIAGGALAIWVDYVGGPATQYPVFYVVPVLMAAWYTGLTPALTIAALVPLFHLWFLIAEWPHEGSLVMPIVGTVARSIVIALLALWFGRLAEHERKLHRYVVKLEGLLPICSFCKAIRNEAGDWESLECFMAERSDADFTHGLCPHCVREHYSTH